MPKGQKHLVRCRCVLPQFKRLRDPPAHQFVVFSVIDDSDTVVQKHAQCNNCGIVHRVYDLGRSEILEGKDHMASVVTVDDVKVGLSGRIVELLERFNADLSTWEHVQFIIENQHWGSFVVLASENDGHVMNGKLVRIVGENTFRVQPFSYDTCL